MHVIRLSAFELGQAVGRISASPLANGMAYRFLISREITLGASFGVQQKPGAVSRPGGSRSFGEYSLLEDSRYTSQEDSVGRFD